MKPDEGAALLAVTLDCCPAWLVPKRPPEALLPCAWPKLQPDPPADLFAPPPNRLLPPPPPTPPPPNREFPPAVLVLPNGFVADEAGGLALDPNNPPAGVEVAVFVWPKGLLELPLVAGGLKNSDGLDFP